MRTWIPKMCAVWCECKKKNNKYSVRVVRIRFNIVRQINVKISMFSWKITMTKRVVSDNLKSIKMLIEWGLLSKTCWMRLVVWDMLYETWIRTVKIEAWNYDLQFQSTDKIRSVPCWTYKLLIFAIWIITSFHFRKSVATDGLLRLNIA